MKTIHKYPIQLMSGRQAVQMPKGAQILDVQQQVMRPVVWALVDASEKLVWRVIRVCQTSGDCIYPEVAAELYLGTVQFEGGSYVLHFFDGGEESP